jgi:hypothetical protein
MKYLVIATMILTIMLLLAFPPKAYSCETETYILDGRIYTCTHCGETTYCN